jgi:predicted branched-subunit amino acid permease
MNTKDSRENFIRGLKSGIPIGIGYLSVSFTFGIMAVSYGFEWWQAVIISMTCVTSAGQLAGIGIMRYPAQYIQMLVTQLTINVRYSFMTISLSQKAEEKFKGIYRWLLGFMATDEVFAVSIMEKEVTRSFFAGLIIVPYAGWQLGTLAGAVLGNVLPHRITSALGIAIYAMFIAIVVPEMKKSLAVVYVVVFALVLRTVLYYVPFFSGISDGIAVSICAIASAVFGAAVFPVKEEENGN